MKMLLGLALLGVVGCHQITCECGERGGVLTQGMAFNQVFVSSDSPRGQRLHDACARFCAEVNQ